MASDPSYNDSHRAFLQAFMARGSLTYEESRPILSTIQSSYLRRPIRPDDITEEDFNAYIATLSSAVSAFDYEIRSTTHQITKAKTYGFLNAASDGLTQAATGFSADEIAFVKRVLDAIFETFNTKRREVCAITGTQALQLHKARDGQGSTQINGNGETPGGSGGQLTMSNAEDVLGALVSQGWFEKSRKGFYSLSPRALMELRVWLIETYNDQEESDADDAVENDSRFSGQPIKMCKACKEIVTVGQRCTDKSCPIRLHHMCTDRFFRMQKNTKCPKCKKSWEAHHQVGEKAAEAHGPRRSTGQIGTPRQPNTQTTGADEDDEDEDEDEDEDADD